MPKISKKRAAICKAELDKLRSKLDRGITPADVVKEAKKKSSPMHSFFEWDVKKAATQRWLEQARDIIQAVKVKYVDWQGNPTEVRAYRTTYKKSPPNVVVREYEPRDVVAGDEELRTQQLKEALDELEEWSDLYCEYKELADILKYLKSKVPKLRDEIFG